MLLTEYTFDHITDSLLDRSLENVSQHLTALGYPKGIVENICYIKFVENNPDYYLYYPYLFNSVFNFYDQKVLDKLSIAGFLFYRSIIFMDDIFDNKEKKGSFNDFLTVNICQEETIKILSSLFRDDSNFWKIWSKRKLEYVKAYEMDKLSHKISTFNQYVTLCDYKSSFGKIAIDSLFFLTGQKYQTEYQRVLKSHKDYYVAFQILDDISDYEEDYRNGQFNISESYLRKKISNIDSYSLQNQKKQLYLQNIAGELNTKALRHVSKAIEAVVDYEMPRWQSELQIMHNTIITHNLNIDGYIKFNSISINGEIENKEGPSNEQSTERGLQYMWQTQEQNGSWIDYFNDAGNSNVWTTSFVCYFLSFCENYKSDLEKSKEFILSNRCQGQNLWGYNSLWIPDADSTSFAILALHSMGLHFKESELEEWFSFQREDGGFCTYRNERELLAALNSRSIKNVDGWLNSHFCVSAVAYLVFCELGITNTKKQRLENYLVKKLRNSNETPYWWTSRDYSISFLILACCSSMNSKIFDLCCNEFNNKIWNDGEMFTNEFYAGLRLLSTIKSKSIFNYRNQSEELISKFLFGSQNENGSWKANYSMRIPSPEVIFPESQVRKWRRDNKGTNIILQDFNRTFTSVVCLVATEHYKTALNGN